MGLLKLADKHSPQRLENACALALRYTASPQLQERQGHSCSPPGQVARRQKETARPNPHALTLGSDYSVLLG